MVTEGNSEVASMERTLCTVSGSEAGAGCGQREGSGERLPASSNKPRKPQAFNRTELDSANHTSEGGSGFVPRAS